LIDDGKPIQIYGNGNTVRDYTFISDVIFGLSACLVKDLPGFQVFNLGNNHTISLQELITKIELFSQENAIIKYEKEKPGDVPLTSANIEKAKRVLGYSPQVDLEEGLRQFNDWFRNLTR
jgi:UDP-glucuronate 4-epimerase